MHKLETNQHNTLIKTWDQLSHDLEMEDFPQIPDAEIRMIQAIAERVKQLLRGNPELLMSHLYRLDVDEAKVQKMIFENTDMPVHEGIAQLIWNRQKMRIQTKEQYKQKPIDGWEDF